MIEARVHRAFAVFALSPPREGDEREVGPPMRRAQALRDLVSVEMWQADVEQHDVGPEGIGHRQRLEAIVREPCLVSGEARGDSGACSDLNAGRRTVKVLPWPTPSLCAVIAPPCSVTRPFDSASPMPSPPAARSMACCTCENISKIRGSASGGMPMPVSLTRATMTSPS